MRKRDDVAAKWEAHTEEEKARARKLFGMSTSAVALGIGRIREHHPEDRAEQEWQESHPEEA